MLKKTKLSPKEVKAYEEMSGFKTTGEVYIQTHDKKTQAKIDKIMEELYLPNDNTNNPS